MFDILPVRNRVVIRRFVGVRCEAVTDDGFRLIGRTIRDLSSTGAFLETDADLVFGELVYLAFQAPRTRRWLDACALVARRVSGRRETDRGKRGVGLRFVSMDATDRAILEASLRKMPPPIPERSVRLDYANAVLAAASGGPASPWLPSV